MNLEQLRKQIDGVNTSLLELFEQRMALTKQVALHKKEQGLEVYHPEREQAILEQISAKASVENEQAARVFFSVLMDISKCQQKSAIAAHSNIVELILSTSETSAKPSYSVACQGVPGAYSQIAAEQLFANKATLAFSPSFEDVFRAVTEGKADYGILPVDNSSNGTVGEVYNLMRQSNVFACRSTKVKAEHCLCAKPGTELDMITEVYSHPQALQQCSWFLKEHPKMTEHAFSNTAAAARYVAENYEAVAAICSKRSAELYGLEVLAHSIQNAEENYTRFLCFSKQLQLLPENNRISLAVAIPNQPGSLYRLLTKFAVANVNMTKIESRPLGTRNFDYMFYIDFSGHLTDKATLDLLDDLSSEYDYFQFFGSYQETEE